MTNFPNFVSPHVHVQSLDSASTPEAFAAREVELDTGALVVTDHGTLGACQKVYELATKGVEIKQTDGTKKKVKLTPVLGLEGYFRDDDCPILNAAGIAKEHPLNKKGEPILTEPVGFQNYIKYHHLTFHFQDQPAFFEAVDCLSHARVEQHGAEVKPLFTWSDLERLGATNTTITTGCLIGMVQRHLLAHQNPVMARKYYERLRALVKPGNFYVEVFPHVCSHNWVEGVFLTVQEENKEPEEIRYYAGKNLKTNVGEIRAEDLAKAFKREHCKHTHLVAVKDWYTWNERPAAKLLKVEYVENFIQNECTPYAPDGDVQLGANKFMIELAEEFGDPILISDDSHYAHPDEKIIQDVRLAQSGSWRFYGSYHRQSSAEAWKYFNERLGVDEKKFASWVDNSRAWVERFKGFKFTPKVSLPTKFYEAKYAEVGAKTSLDYTVHLIKQHGRFDKTDPARVARLQQEIKLLHKNGIIDLLPYFFLDEEVCRLYRDHGMLTGPGRGSAAGLYLSYLLGITHVDPLKYGLSVDRFLTLDRIKSGKMPDIDQDLPDRDLLDNPETGWLKQRFGDHVAQISTVNTLKLASACKDVVRFMRGRVPPDVEVLTKNFEKPPQGLEDHKFVFGYEDSGNWVEGSIKYDKMLQTFVRDYPEEWKIVEKCLGLGRSLGRHACGFAVANEPLTKLGIPLTVIGGYPCTAFTSAAVEAMGVLKNDFLVINSLKDIGNAITMIQRRSGLTVPEGGIRLNGKWVPSIRLLPRVHCDGLRDETPEDVWADIWDLPEDQEVFKDIATSNTETVFQFNTPGAQQWLRQFAYRKKDGNYAIDSIESMSAFTALDRPGPLDAYVQTPGDERCTECKDGRDAAGEPCTHGKHNMMVEYARRARGAEPSVDIFPIFNKLFPETHGIMVYQEQLQRLYQEVTGCTGAEAEEFRGNVAKKKKEKIIAAYDGFIAGATKQLGSREQAEAVWQFIQTWAAYGFNKSHSVCYCIIAYACAYLKRHFPLEWWCAVLKHAKKDEINSKFWRYCGDLIDLPDVLKSWPNFEIVGERIQAPLTLMLGFGEGAQKELLELLAASKPTTIGEFCQAVYDRRVANGEIVTKTKVKTKTNRKTGEVTKTEVTEKKLKLAHSSLHRGVLYTLIVSGAMDSLFPPGTPVVQMLAEYEEALAKANKKKKVEAVKPEYNNVTQYRRYQMRKRVLPAYSERILKMLIERKHETVFFSQPRQSWKYRGPDRVVAFATADEVEAMQAAMDVPEGGYRCAVAAFVDDVRVFSYSSGSRKACELMVDVDGARMKFVKWPDFETGELDPKYNEGLKGALVILAIYRHPKKKQFNVDELEVVQPSLAFDDEVSPAEQSPTPDPSAIPGINADNKETE